MENEGFNFNDNENIEIEDAIEVENFSYDGFQVVRGEFFAHLFEPSITFNKCKVYVNTACIKKLSDIEYVQILVNSEEKKLAIRPCSGEEKDSFLWCTAKRKPKQISCKIFSAMISTLMDWNPEYRYKLLGKLIKSNGEYLFIFDLKSSEMYERKIEEGTNKPKTSRTPIFPAEWKNQFGLPVEEHKKQLQIDLFNGYAIFGLNDKKESSNLNNNTSIIEEDNNEQKY
jgi:hypothetical protein